MAGNKNSNTLFQSKQRYNITHKVKSIAVIASIAITATFTTPSIASTQSQCQQVKSKLCESYKELNQLRKQQSFIEMGFSPAGPHYQWLQQAKNNSENPKYDKFMLYECLNGELGCDGSGCVLFGDIVTLAMDATNRSHPGQYSEHLHLMDNNFKKFCK